MKNVDSELQVEVRKYIEYKFNFDSEISQEEETNVLAKLSQPIRERLIISTNINILKKCQWLSDNFSDDFLVKLSLVIGNESKLH